MSKNNPVPNVAWPEDRRHELADFQLLVTEVTTINKGSHCLERIQKCIDLAEKLSKTNFDTGRSSFVQFLIEEATRPLEEGN